MVVSSAAPRGTRPGPTGAPHGGRRGWGRRAPPHLDLPTPLSPMMRIFRVVSTSSSIPSARPARPGPTPTEAPCAGCGCTACACAPRRPFSLAPFAACPAHAPRAPQVRPRREDRETNIPAPAGGACAEGGERSGAEPSRAGKGRPPVSVRACAVGRPPRARACEGPGLRGRRPPQRSLRRAEGSALPGVLCWGAGGVEEAALAS